MGHGRRCRAPSQALVRTRVCGHEAAAEGGWRRDHRYGRARPGGHSSEQRAVLVVVDPRRTESAEVADEHLFIKPGADAYFLFSIVHELFAAELVRLGRFEAFTDGIEEIRALADDFSPESTAAATGIDAETTRRIARELADHPRACVYGRIGTCTVEFGTLASWLVDVVNILLGRYDEPGGMMFPRPATGQHEPGNPMPPIPIGPYRTAARGLPTGAPGTNPGTEGLGKSYHLTLWHEPYISASGRHFSVCQMHGFGGNSVVLAPNGLVGFRVGTAGHPDAEAMGGIADGVRPFGAHRRGGGGPRL